MALKHTLPTPPHGKYTAGHVDLKVGHDAVKDAVVMIRCCVVDDNEGFLAILNSIEHPHQLTAAIACIAGRLFLDAGLDEAIALNILQDVAGRFSNYLLDQKKPPQGA